MRRRVRKQSGQSIVENVLLLALVAAIVIVAVKGIGQATQAGFAKASKGFEESSAEQGAGSGSASTAGHGGPAATPATATGGQTGK